MVNKRYKKRPTTSIANALTVTCSRCNALPGDPCMGARVVPQERKTPHAERFSNYFRAQRAAS